MDKLDPLYDKPKKRSKKASKIQDLPVNPPSGLPEMGLASDAEPSDELKKTIANILKNSAEKYSEIAEKELKDTRDDFDALQPIVSEFLDDFIIIGHTLEGNRVVMRYTSTPADMDKFTELCKKVLVRMMIQEARGE